MGINPPSLYAAFGDKEKLFLAAVDRYRCGPGAAAGGLLVEAPTARAAIANLLEAAAAELATDRHPRLHDHHRRGQLRRRRGARAGDAGDPTAPPPRPACASALPAASPRASYRPTPTPPRSPRST